MEFYFGESKGRKFLALVGGFILHLVLGNISIYMASYLQHKGESVTVDDLSIIFPMQILGSTLTQLLGSHLTQNYNPWLTISIGNSIVIFSVFLTSFLKTYALIVLIYGILYGMGVGLSYTTPLIISWSHFSNYKGRVSGFILTGIGLGPATHMINPNNDQPNEKFDGTKYFDAEISYRYPRTLRWLALIYLGMTCLVLIFVMRPSKQQNIAEMLSGENECPSIREGVKSKSFYLLFIMALFSITPGIFVVNSYKSFGKSKINDDEFLAVVGSVSAFFNGSLRLVWGLVMDKIGFKKTYFILLVVQTVFLGSLYFIAVNKGLYLIWVSLILCCEGGHFAIFPTIVARIYGKRMGSKIYGVLFYGFAIGAILGYIIDITLIHIIGYLGLYWILGSLAFISMTLLTFFKEENLWQSKPTNSESISETNAIN